MNVITSRSRCINLLFLLLVLFKPGNANAQDLDNVSITGRVVDQNGAAVPAAHITWTSAQLRRNTLSDSQGRFQLIQLQPGSFSFQVESTGFASYEQKASLLSGQNLQLEVILYPAELTTNAVTITATETPPIDTTRVVVGSTLGSVELDSIPVFSRSSLDIVFTLPGVTEEPLSTRELAEDRNASHALTPEEAGTFALAGGPAYSNNITIDGLDNNDDRAARERFQPSLGAVEEVQVITNQFSAEYGRASGGRVNFRTKGGSNHFRGRGFYFFRDESLNANTFRNNSLGLKRLPLQEQNPGFSISGPMKFGPIKNRTFFFTSYELTELLDHALVDTLVPVEQNSRFPLPAPTHPVARRLEDATAPSLSSDVAPFIASVNTPSRNQALTMRVDHQFNESHNVSFVIHIGLLANLRRFGGGNRLAEALQAQMRNSQAYSYSDNLVFSSALVNQFRIQFSRLQPGLKPKGGDGPVVLIAINDPLDHSGTLIAGASTSGATDRSESRWQLQDILAFVKGPHSIKLGLDTQRISSTFIDLADASGTYNFASAGDFLVNLPNRYRQTFLGSSTQRNTYVGVFVQDEWQLNSKLMFNFGLRYERETIIQDLNNFGPRIGVAYDPMGSGKTVIRAGAGVFYNRALLRTVDDFTLGKQQLFFDTNLLRDPISGRTLSNQERREFISTNLRFPETLTLTSTLVQTFANRNTNFARRLDPGLRIPESYQANIGFERDLGSGFVVEANFTVNRGLHLWREFNANAPIVPTGYANLSNYLASRDFSNFRSSSNSRPIYNAASAGELVRFSFRSSDPSNPNGIIRITEAGVPISIFNLNSQSTTAIEVALAALNNLRPDPNQNEIEQLISVGNSFYRGLTIELRKRFAAGNGLNFSFRTGYTLSSLIDDGIVNTSDALMAGNFYAERARSLLDRRHRFVFSGSFDLPGMLGGLRFAPLWRIASGAPFNISLGGVDRNLDDVGNDRPNFSADTKLLHWRPPGSPLDPRLLTALALPTIGQSGNLPRNAGRGPGLFLLDLNVTREFKIREGVRIRPSLELDNVLNKTVFSFGSEFINFNALSPTATAQQREAFVNSFLIPTRTLRQRQLRLGLRFDF